MFSQESHKKDNSLTCYPCIVSLTRVFLPAKYVYQERYCTEESWQATAYIADVRQDLPVDLCYPRYIYLQDREDLDKILPLLLSEKVISFPFHV